MPSIAAFLLITLPWLNPFSSGPTPAAVSLLFSWACAAALLGLSSLASGRVLAGRLVSVTAAAWLVTALISSLLGLLQYFGATAVFGPWVNTTGMGEAYANLRQRNQFATLTNIGLAALLWWVANSQAAPASPYTASHPAPRNERSWFFVAAAALLAMGNAASSSRTGLVQLVMLLAMAWVWSRHGSGWHQPHMRRVLLAAALAYGIAALALPALAGLDPSATGIVARLQAGDSACGSRLTLWGNVLHLIALKPWFGWGWGELDYAHFITLYPGTRFCEILDNAHNLPLHLAVELGVPLAVAVFGGGAWMVWRAKPWRELDASRQMAWAVLAVILLHSMLEYPLWYGPFQMAFGLCIWLLWRPRDLLSGAADVTPATHRNCASRTARINEFMPLATVIKAFAAIFLIAFSAYAAWDYQRISQIYLTPKMRSEAYRNNTLKKVGDSWLFQDQLRFAELTTVPLSRDNATHIRDLALALLHFSPEPRVIEKLIESDALLGLDEEALFYLARYQAAFPENHAHWAEKNPM